METVTFYDIAPGRGFEVTEALGGVAVPPAEVQLSLFAEPHPELFEDGAN